MSKQMNRRNFLIVFGAGAATAISGYFSSVSMPFSQFPTSMSNDKPQELSMPCLRTDVIFGRDDDFITVSRHSEYGTMLCAVNDLGAGVLRLLDGNHTITDIAYLLSKERDITFNDTFQANIALFVAQLSMADFLSKNFWVNIVDHYDV